MNFNQSPLFKKANTEPPTAKDTQKALFQIIKLQLPKGTSLADVIGDLLSVSASCAYRRIRGETLLDIEELLILSKKYHFSLDELFNIDASNQKIQFEFQELSYDNLLNYLDYILVNLKSAKQLTIVAKHIPTFYMFLFPQLLAFKAYFYMRVLWPNEPFQNSVPIEFFRKFIHRERKEIKDKCEEIIRTYLLIPSTEIWNANTFDGHLTHIEYAWDSGYFVSKEEALQIVDVTKLLMEQIKKQAICGKKFSIENPKLSSNVKMYYSNGLELEHIVHSESEQQTKAFLIYNTGDYLGTSSEYFCTRTEEYINNVCKCSNVISVSGERDRHKMFKIIEQKIDHLRAKIEMS